MGQGAQVCILTHDGHGHQRSLRYRQDTITTTAQWVRPVTGDAAQGAVLDELDRLQKTSSGARSSARRNAGHRALGHDRCFTVPNVRSGLTLTITSPACCGGAGILTLGNEIILESTADGAEDLPQHVASMPTPREQVAGNVLRAVVLAGSLRVASGRLALDEAEQTYARLYGLSPARGVAARRCIAEAGVLRTGIPANAAEAFQRRGIIPFYPSGTHYRCTRPRMSHPVRWLSASTRLEG